MGLNSRPVYVQSLRLQKKIRFDSLVVLYLRIVVCNIQCIISFFEQIKLSQERVLPLYLNPRTLFYCSRSSNRLPENIFPGLMFRITQD